MKIPPNSVFWILKRLSVLAAGCLALFAAVVNAQAPKQRPITGSRASADVSFPPSLPGDQTVVSDRSERFLTPPTSLRDGVAIATTSPRVEFLFYPGQDYPGKPWSNWGDGLAEKGIYHSAIGDHLAIGAKGDGSQGTGTAFVFAYDADRREFRKLVNTTALLALPEGHYTPGKIHSRIDLGSDGWLYFGTHRGSKRSTTDAYHYRGDWIMRCRPDSETAEVIARGPVPRHAIPTSVLDPDRLIFYGGTAAGLNSEQMEDRFFAYDVRKRELIYNGPNGPSRYMIFVRSTGRVYYVPGKLDGPLMRFDPATDREPVEVPGSHIGVRAATRETPDGFVYSVSLGQRSDDADLWSFNVQTEECRKIGTAAVGSQAYVASIDADPTGRFLYYLPGAHGGSDRDGSPVVQFDTRTGTRKVIAFLEPFYTENYGFTLKGTYSTAIDPAGDKLYITWNVGRGTRSWDCCGLTVVHIPESER